MVTSTSEPSRRTLDRSIARMSTDLGSMDFSVYYS